MCNFVGGGVRLWSWRGEEAAGIKYGTVRDFMIDEGVIKMFNDGTVTAPVKKAIPLIEFLKKKFFLPKAPEEKDTTAMHDLIWGFLRWAGIKGYSWEATKQNPAIQAGFAQSLLEYFAYIVMPEWNKAETLLTDAISYHTDEAKDAMKKELVALHTLFLPQSIFKFLDEHIRFPLIETNVIDYDNADDDQIGLLDKYRIDSGYYSRQQKAGIIEDWDEWVTSGTFRGIDDSKLEANYETLKNILKKAGGEKKYTGDSSFYNKVMGWFMAFTQEKNRRFQIMKAGGHIVRNPHGVEQVVMPSPAEQAKLEEERKRQEEEQRQKEEEERRKREEEETKRIEAEAQRKQALLEAEAQINAANKIKEEEERYEAVLQKMITDPGSVTQEEIDKIGEDINSLKQEAENRIKDLPRDQRELKLALIRGDKLSDKTLAEVKETAIGLQGSL